MADDSDQTAPQQPNADAPASDTDTPSPSDPAKVLLELALSDLQERRTALQQEIEELSKRKQQLESELTKNFAGQSDAIARRVKGFQEYLGGALQDLVQSVENLELVVQPMVVQPSPLDQQAMADQAGAPIEANQAPAAALADTFKPDEPLILIDAAEGSIEIPVLQFPLWLAFAAGPNERLDDDDLL